MKKLILFFTLAISSLNSFAQDNQTKNNERYYQACLQQCIEFYDNPGHQLRQCIAECSIRYPTETQDPAKPQWCETYEDDCSRPPNEF